MSIYLNKCSLLKARYMMRGRSRRTETTFVCVCQRREWVREEEIDFFLKNFIQSHRYRKPPMTRTVTECK